MRSAYVRNQSLLTLLTERERQRLEVLADREDRSLSSLIRIAVLRMLEDEESRYEGAHKEPV